MERCRWREGRGGGGGGGGRRREGVASRDEAGRWSRRERIIACMIVFILNLPWMAHTECNRSPA